MQIKLCEALGLFNLICLGPGRSTEVKQANACSTLCLLPGQRAQGPFVKCKSLRGKHLPTCRGLTTPLKKLDGFEFIREGQGPSHKLKCLADVQ